MCLVYHVHIAGDLFGLAVRLLTTARARLQLLFVDYEMEYSRDFPRN
jgi:hypothetical protein